MKITVSASKKTLAKIKKLKGEIAAKRDALRDLIFELEEIGEGCDEALDALESAADAMSQLL